MTLKEAKPHLHNGCQIADAEPNHARLNAKIVLELQDVLRLKFSHRLHLCPYPESQVHPPRKAFVALAQEARYLTSEMMPQVPKRLRTRAYGIISKGALLVFWADRGETEIANRSNCDDCV